MNILVLSDYDPGNAAVIKDFLYSFDKYSKNDIFYFFWPRHISTTFQFDEFDVILIFWSVTLAPPPGFTATFPPQVAERIRKSSALKVLFLQDEYRAVRPVNTAMAELGVEVVFSCTDPKFHDIFYPTSNIPSLKSIYPVLPGYVPDYMELPSLRNSAKRKIDIGYRSRQVSFSLGDIGYEKTIIAERFLEIGPRHGFSVNISIRERDRIYGRHWIDFLKSTRFQLGTPSGASVIDFDGSIYEKSTRFQRKHPEISYSEIRHRFFADVDGRYVIDTISPRFFEYTATGNVMVLHEGAYGGILEPDHHYILVRKDYSNIYDVIEKMKDISYLERLKNNSYEELILSGKYSYKCFVADFDKIISSHLAKSGSRHVNKVNFYWRAFAASGQTTVPYKGREFVLPVGNGLGYWLHGAREWLIRQGPLIGRALRHRGGSATTRAKKGLVTVAACLGQPAFRHVLLRGLFHPVAGISRYNLLKELALLSVVDRNQRDKQPLGGFYVLPTFEDGGRTLVLRSNTRRALPRRLMSWRRNESQDFRRELNKHTSENRIRTIRIHIPRFSAGLSLSIGPLSGFFPREQHGVFLIEEIPRLLANDPVRLETLLKSVVTFAAAVNPRARQNVKAIRYRRWLRSAVRQFARARTIIPLLPFALRMIGRYAPLRSAIFGVAKLGIKGHETRQPSWLRELQFLMALYGIQRAEIFTDTPFHLDLSLTNCELRIESKRGTDYETTTDHRRQLLEQCWAQLQSGGKLKVVWDHSAISPTLAWRPPGHLPYASVIGDIGSVGLNRFQAYASQNPRKAVQYLANLVGVHGWRPTLHPGRIRRALHHVKSVLLLGRLVMGQRDTRALAIAGLVKPGRGFGRQDLLQEILWLSVLRGIQRAEIFTDTPFHLDLSLTNCELCIESKRGTDYETTTDHRRQLLEQCWAQLQSGGKLKVVWDHSAISPTLAWRLPGYLPYASVIGDIGSVDLNTFQAYASQNPRKAVQYLANLVGVHGWRPTLHPGRIRRALHHVKSVLLLGRLVMGQRDTRALAIAGLVKPGRGLGRQDLLREILRLSVLRGIQRTEIFTTESFYLDLDRNATEVRLTSCKERRSEPRDGKEGRARLIDSIRNDLRQGQALTFVWDHRAVGTTLSWRLPESDAWSESAIGADGTCALTGLTGLATRRPHTAAALLAAITAADKKRRRKPHAQNNSTAKRQSITARSTNPSDTGESTRPIAMGHDARTPGEPRRILDKN